MPKKICIVTGRFPARSETFVVNHAVGLAHRGYEVTVVCQGVGLGMSLAELDALDAVGLSRVHIKPYGLVRVRNAIQMLSRLIRRPKLIRFILTHGPWTRRELFLADAYAEEIEKDKPELLHIHYGIYAAVLCRIGIPSNAIVSWHGYDANIFPRRRGEDMYHALFANPSVKHTVGSSFMEERLEALGCQIQKLSKVPMGVDLNKFKFVDRSERTSSVLKIVSVGRLDEMKGHCYLINAVAQLIDKGVSVQLRIIGEGPLREVLDSQIKESTLGDYIELLGALNSRVVRRELESADLFALAGVEAENGRVETQGVVLIEAQATGLPIVASKVGGVPDSLIDGETGILCDPENVDQLAQALQRYAEHKELRMNHGRAASQFVQQRFSLSTMLDSFEALYDRI